MPGPLGSAPQKNTGAVGTPQAGPAVGAASPTTAAASGLLSNPNWQSEIAGYLSGSYAPAEGQQGLTAALGGAQLGLVGPQLGVSSAELGNQAGYSLANSLLGYEGIGLQSQALASQAGTEAQQQGLEQAVYGVQQTQFPEEKAQADLANANAQRQISDSGAITGTTQTQGHGRAVATQQSQYGWNLADIYRNQQLAQLGQQSEQVGFGGQEEQIANARSQLGLAAQGQGLSAQQATNQLGFGLQQLGVSASPEQYLTGIANAQSGEAQQLSALGSQASLIGGLGPSFLSGY